jgi:hypothetical protein
VKINESKECSAPRPRKVEPVFSSEGIAMAVAIQVRTTILSGHRIDIAVPELPEGRTATVFIVLDEDGLPKRPLHEVLGDYPGGQLFHSAEEVDAYLRQERDSWDK